MDIFIGKNRSHFDTFSIWSKNHFDPLPKFQVDQNLPVMLNVDQTLFSIQEKLLKMTQQSGSKYQKFLFDY